ncbi:MAG: AT hook domain-containing protein [Traorella sp.]
MKGPGIKDYLSALEEKKIKAKEAGLEEIEISSKALHQEISLNHATMPTCCQAMYKVTLIGDEIIKTPKGSTGYGSHLIIRYKLNDLNREQRFPNKKRGRPSKSDEEKLASKKAKMKRNTEDLNNILKLWLIEQGYTFNEEKNELIASNQDRKWIINVQGVKRGRKQSLPNKISELITKIEDSDTYYSIAFNDTTLTRKQWSEISNVVKEQLKLSVLLADKQGNILEL